MVYREKADPKILQKCEDFVIANSSIEGDYDVYKIAMDLCHKLIDSLLASHKDFDEAVKFLKEKYDSIKEGPKKDFYAFKFNDICLQLDKNAQNILAELERIERNNKPNYN